MTEVTRTDATCLITSPLIGQSEIIASREYYDFCLSCDFDALFDFLAKILLITVAGESRGHGNLRRAVSESLEENLISEK